MFRLYWISVFRFLRYGSQGFTQSETLTKQALSKISDPIGYRVMILMIK